MNVRSCDVLSPAARARLVALRKQGVEYCNLAERFGCSISLAWNVVAEAKRAAATVTQQSAEREFRA